MKAPFIFLTLIFGALIQSCQVSTAKVEANKKLVIVSDYLTDSDSLLFEDFIKKEKVNLLIINKTANGIIGNFRNNSFNTGFDIIMLKSLYNVNRLSKKNYFHSIDELADEFPEHRNFLSLEHDFIGFGVNPFIIAYNPDSTLWHRTYSDLKTHPFYTLMSDEEMAPMLAGIMSKMNKVKSYNWMRKFKNQQLKPNPYAKINALLTTLSEYKQLDLNDSIFKNLTAIYYPNQSANGAFYNLNTFAIVNQAENYTTANKFIQYYMSEKHNRKLNIAIGTIPIHDAHKSPRLYNVRPEELLQYYSMTERILTKIN